MHFIRRLAVRHGPLARASASALECSRRDALRASLAAGSALLLSACGAGRVVGRDSRRRVVVVGGGFAGLACAYELLAAGHDPLVLEARAAVGGRVLTFRDFVPQGLVEGGAELIGANHPTWIAYAERFRLPLRPVDDGADLAAPIAVGDRLLTDAEAESVWAALEPALATSCAVAREIDADAPWRSPRAAELDASNIADAWLAGLDADPLTRAVVAQQISGDNGVANERASWLGMLAAVKGGGLEDFWTQSEAFRCASGNQSLAHALARELGDRVRCATPVVHIDVSGAVARVRTAAGEVFEADDVVLAVPPTVWADLAIEPALPADLAPQMGRATKFLTHVRRRFWLAEGRSAYSQSGGPFSWTWESTDGQDLAPASGAGLTAFSGGPAADVGRAYAPIEREDALLDELERLQPGARSAVIATRFMDWPAERRTRAGYSFPAPGDITRVGERLRNGIGRLHFAGEHTSHAFPGYMEGALSSGVRVARQLA
jgi:monoamine oxidase